MRLYLKPFVRWIWAGTVLMALGGLLAATDKRYRKLLRERKTAANRSGSDLLADLHTRTGVKIARLEVKKIDFQSGNATLQAFFYRHPK